MRIQYGSDFHLEHCRTPPNFADLLVPAAPYLALAGDIGNPFDPTFDLLLNYVSKGWRRVFYVAGNHEYYCRKRITKWSTPKSMLEVQNQLKACFAKYENLHFLHSDSVYLADENVAVVGATLWSHVPTEVEYDAAERINDYSFIAYDLSSVLTPRDTNAIHAKEAAFLRAEVDAWAAKGARVCILTHHMPSALLIRPEYAGFALNCCFASDQGDLLRHPAVCCWIYGHTHDVCARELYGTQVCVNARGYISERSHGFRPDAVVEVVMKKTYGGGGGDEEITFV